ncbi:uncharacterized protein EV420DRAFT_52782 [Desarmillaria tabescens]|uniref:Uncharacterized protein n=1 Tax=Armillaria tabescens TaxID=1929756 RepID=A0AA39TTF5_ARMTA|nr:uncharacterized protein EV420DRAFT_52782 [Desarmillaria tabescens]KAK0469632.1 hypothetical protein EV420DRAFT_52782 [Desarmillaria tabescens]
MGLPCLSSASILRCESLTRIQYVVLVIPSAVEIIFSTSLIFTNRGAGRRHLLLTVEGWSYLTLAILDLISHILPAARDNLRTFEVLDIVVAVASSLPILFYTAFLFFFARAELLESLPSRFRKIAQPMLLFFVPVIITLNELASLFGITHRVNDSGSIFIGFKTDRDRDLWTFLTSMTLSLFTVYQLINFCLAFFRLVNALRQQRNLETSSSDQAYLFRGIGWISAGLKLGAIETVVGFAHTTFSGALIRRILRLLARACLCIGIVKGVDIVENFAQFRAEYRHSGSKNEKHGDSNFRPLISNPRLSTFRQLSPSATEFHTTPRGPGRGTAPRATSGLSGLNALNSLKTEPLAQRVTIDFAQGAPLLQMRPFSSLDVPNPDTLVTSRPGVDGSSSEDNSISSSNNSEERRFSSTAPRGSIPDAALSGTLSLVSESSTDSLNAVHKLASQFPALPPRAAVERNSVTPASRRKSGRKVSGLVPWPEVEEGFSTPRRVPIPSPLRSRRNYSIPLSLQSTDSDGYTFTSTPGITMRSELSTQQTTPATSVYEPDKGKTQDEIHRRPLPRPRNIPSQWLESSTSGVERYRRPSAVSFVSSPTAIPFHMRQDSDVSKTSSLYDETDAVPSTKDPFVGQTNMNLTRPSSSVPRIKNVGKVTRRYTPTPVWGETRSSIYIEPIMIPPKAAGFSNVQIIQGDDDERDFSSRSSVYNSKMPL